MTPAATCDLRAAVAVVAAATPEQLAALEADLRYELAHAIAYRDVLAAIIAVLNARLAELA